ncbi:MAG: triose-phosphate isomerase [Candidatus Aenigmarchaeota archaeon]|nr:triose-phosphate isomerase [Candidatus Aenigmarchaeota archaeon]
MRGILVVNFKAYPQAMGANALLLAEAIQRSIPEAIVAAQAADLAPLAQRGMRVFAQHVDPLLPGARTGSILAESVKAAGAAGSLLNHAEKPLEPAALAFAVERCKLAGLETLVCVDNLARAVEISRLRPTYLAFEDPELIGKRIPVSAARPEALQAFARVVARKTIPLCGAGIASGEDARAARELGLQGVLVSSAVVTSRSPQDILADLREGLG